MSQLSQQFFFSLVQKLFKSEASDLHIKEGEAPAIRKNRELVILNEIKHRFSKADMKYILKDYLTPDQLKKVSQGEEVDFSLVVGGVGRFRGNAYLQSGQKWALALRLINEEIPSLADLNLPDVLKAVALEKRGLVLVTGAVGNGKSTALASMVDYRNSRKRGHIITVEDPIEYMFTNKKSMVSQRQVGQDTKTFLTGLKSALRQDPNVILMGEIRDEETFSVALSAAETGQLVFATAHTRNASETISRVLGTFPPGKREQVRAQFASCLKAIVSLRLVPVQKSSGLSAGMIPATEVLINTEHIKDCLGTDDRVQEIRDAMESGSTYGMHTLDQSVMKLFRDGVISYDDALEYANSADNMALAIGGIKAGSGY